jgi:prepilin-type processing-associated H-X9-DG protein
LVQRTSWSILLLIAIVIGGTVGLKALLDRWRANSARVTCASCLHQIGLAMRLYADAHGGSFPDSFTTIMLTSDIAPAAFVCPLTDALDPSGPTSRAAADALTDGRHLSHVYAARGLTLAEVTANTVLAYEPLASHGDGMNVLFGDGRVEFLDPKTGAMLAAHVAAGESPVVWAGAGRGSPED